MSNDAFFVSDLHLSHEGILKGHRGTIFSSVKEHNETILDNIFSLLKPGDRLYHLGDLAWKYPNEDYQELFNMFRKYRIELHLTIGNHDRPTQWKHKAIKSVSYMKEIKVEKQSITLCHYPLVVWNKSHYGSWNLHGHIHYEDATWNKALDLSEYDSSLQGKKLNVNTELNDFKPWSFEEVKSYMDSRGNNWDFISKAQREAERKNNEGEAT